ncbi:carboxypeptidase-like regulatory domain-containing protein [Sulfurovum sp. zt1-1]|uniref:Carboxypeptidase-like regulatory domain-containing protein n=1 Tax=Sulfurovum zhangzhouensis TaxID=3019067 RepID=A0ABT7QZ21_9BACT|nr:carboxypeptidase regulatory-like domain-containing protein [Sulfurovum zhangzhouensis]MDM5271536.1 carboxypeptidase-like regulatory domain-containing protein [Sulfurovum zhangzhouensis]
MKKLLHILLLVIVPLAAIASEGERGTLSVLLFSDGKPLVGNEVKIDGKLFFQTDKDGTVMVPLTTGRHQLEIVGKSESGQNLGYFKKPIEIKKNRNTEVIATLSKTGADSIDIDIPVAVAASEKRKDEIATGEGKLVGTILSSEGNTPIAGARIFVRGTSVDVRSDENGRFAATVPSGKSLSISVVHSAYSAQTIGGIVVKKDGVTSKSIKLTPASMELEEFVVLAPKIEGSLADVMQEEKKSSAVTNILGSEEMSKKGDSDAASALKRVTGVTLVDGKSIYVRGLGDRYSNIEMNSMPLPSPDPTKRVVPLDIFPSGVISSLKVQKSGTADIPASFGGGYVDIRTKDNISDDYIKVSMGLKANSYTGDNVIGYQGSSTDWTGFDNGYREISQDLLDLTDVVVGESPISFTTRYFLREDLSRFMQEYVGDRKYNLTNDPLPFGGSIGAEVSQHYDIDDENKITVFANYDYSQDHQYREEQLYKYAINQTIPDNPDAAPEDRIYSTLNDLPSNSGVALRSSSEYSQAGIFNVGYTFADVLNLKYTKLYTHTGLKGTKLSIGEFGSNQNEIFSYYDLEWEERTLQADQINGDFAYELFNKKNAFSFGLESAQAELNQPNNYRYIYVDDDGLDSGAPAYLQKTSNQFAKRLVSDDKVQAYYLKNKFFVDLFSEEDYIDIGYSSSNKKRKSKMNSLGIKINGDETEFTDDIDTIYDEYVRPDIWFDDRRFTLENYTQAKNYFDANVDESSLYLSTFLKPTSALDVLVGVRQVNVEQTTTSYYLYSRREHPGEDYDPSKNNTYQKYDRTLELNNELFPSASLKYSFNEENTLDAAYSKTYILPDLREASSGIYSHPYEIADVKGNPDLKNTIINSYDLKYSHYFSDTESIKLGLFYKKLDDPIEDTQESSSSLPIYSFQNSKSATIKGIEIDGRKRLDFLHRFLSDFYLSGNFTYADSKVTLSDDQKEKLSTDGRQLQGLSKTVLNVALSYEQNQRSFTLAYNKMGARIRKVGLKDFESGILAYPDYMEDPASLLDFIWIENFTNGLSLKLKLGNLLNEETVWYQQDQDHAYKTFKKGRDFKASVSFKY